LVEAGIKHRRVLVVVAFLVLLGGFAQLRHAKVDALPEFVPPRVEVQTEALGLSAQEVEQLLTVPLERNFLNGIPFLKTIRSSSVPGLSSIELVFEPGTELFTARQLVQERLSLTAELPNVSRPPQMLQAVSSASRVMMIGLSTKELTPIQLSVLSQFTIRPRLLGVPGVADISIFGARDLQLQVQVDPKRLQQQGVSVDQVITTTGNALFVSPLTFLEASTPGSGGFFDTPNQRLGIQHILPIKTPGDLSMVAIADSAAPRKLGDVATVVEDHQPLIGDAALAGGQGLLLVVEKLPGANTRDVTSGLESALGLLKPGLKGIQVDSSIYRPESFIAESIKNLRGAAVIGALLGAALLVLLFVSWRAAAVCAATIPLSVVAAATVLSLRGETLNSLGIAGLVAAMALIVFDAITITTAMHRRSLPGGDEPAAGISAAVAEVGRPLAVATVIMGVALAPLLFLDGLRLKAFLPSAALSYGLAVLASLVVALTVAPAVGAMLLRPRSEDAPESGLTVAPAKVGRAYGSFLGTALRAPVVAVIVPALVITALGLASITQLRPSLQPSFKERDLLVHWDGPPGTSLEEMGRVINLAAGEVRGLKGIRAVGTHVGRAVSADQVVGSASGEMWISVKPSADHGPTVESVQRVIDGYPGLRRRVSTYFNDRVKDLQGTTGDDLVVRLYGENIDVLKAKGAEIQGLLAGLKGVSNAHVESLPLQPTIQVEVDLARAERRGIKPGDVRRGATTLISGLTVGSLYQDQKVFQVVVVGLPELRHDLTSISDLSLDTPDGGQVRLGDVAKVSVGPGLSEIKHDNVSRSLDVSASVRGRSVASAAKEIETELKGVSFPPEHDARVLTDRQERSSAQRRLLLAGLLAGLLVFLILQAALSSWRLAALAAVAVPVALAGGAIATWVDGRSFTLGSMLGLLTIGGLAVRSSTQLLSGFRRLERLEPALDTLAVVRRGTIEHGVPTGVAALVLAVAFLPFLAIGNVSGSELVRPLAVSLLGGLVTVTFLALVILPAAYFVFGERAAAQSDRPTLPLAWSSSSTAPSDVAEPARHVSDVPPATDESQRDARHGGPDLAEPVLTPLPAQPAATSDEPPHTTDREEDHDA